MLSREKCRCERRSRGPLWVDNHQVAGLAESTVKSYRAAALTFGDFMRVNFPHGEGPEDLDDGIMEWKHMMRPSKAEFEVLVASVEFVLPHVKGKLPWCRAALRGWQKAHVPNHTTPMSRATARLLAIHMVGIGHSWLAIGLMIQRELGLRPAETMTQRWQ